MSVRSTSVVGFYLYHQEQSLLADKTHNSLILTIY